MLRSLVEKIPASDVVAMARDTEKAEPLAALGIEVRQGDYTDYDSLVAAFEGVTESDIATERFLEKSGLAYTIVQHPLYANDLPLLIGANRSVTNPFPFKHSSPLAKVTAGHPQSRNSSAAGVMPLIKVLLTRAVMRLKNCWVASRKILRVFYGWLSRFKYSFIVPFDAKNRPLLFCWRR